MINPILLRSFCTLAELGHFTRTAQRLHMTQSGVSQHIHKLETQLGRPLLLRQGKRFTLTDAGERLYREARGIVESLSSLEQQIREDPSHEGLVRIMSPGGIGLNLYPRLLDLQLQHPKLIIDYRFAPNGDVEKAIKQHDVDIGFLTRPSTLDDINCQHIATEALLLVTPRSFSKPNWEQLLQLGFIDHPDGAHHAALLLGANFSEFQHSSLFEKKGFSNQIGLILEPVSMGLGFTVLPAYAVQAFQKPELLKAHTLNKPVNESLYLGLSQNKPIPNRALTVIEEAKKWL